MLGVIKGVALGETDFEGDVCLSANCEIGHPAILPTAVKFDAATGYKAGKLTTPPLIRECGEHTDDAVGTAEKHLTDTCGIAEVTVDLIRGMIVPEIIEHVVYDKRF